MFSGSLLFKSMSETGDNPLNEPQDESKPIVSYLFNGTAEDEFEIFDGEEHSMDYTYDSERGIVASFDGTNYISGVNIPATNNTTFNIWIKTLNSSQTRRIISLDSGSGTNQPELWIFTATTTGYLGFGSENFSSGTTFVYENTNVTDGNWHMLTVVHDNDNGNVLFYIDGTYKSTSAVSNSNQLIPDIKSGWIGARSIDGSNNTRWFIGLMSNLKIYNRIISSSEVSTLYNAENGVKNGDIQISDLFSYCPLKRNLFDNTENQNDGTGSNISYNIDESKGRYLEANGSNSYISFSSNISNEFNGLGAVSFSIWFRRGTIQSTSQVLISITNATNAKFLVMFNTDNKIQISARSTSADSSQTKYSTNTITDNSWHHLVCIVDIINDNMNMYIDNVSETLTGSVSWGNTSFQSGSGMSNNLLSWRGSTFFFDGDITDMRLYGKALTSVEINTLYTNESSENLPEIFEQAWYPLTENTYDYFGNFNGEPLDTTSFGGSPTEYIILDGVNDAITTFPLKLIDLSQGMSLSFQVSPSSVHNGCIFNGRTDDYLNSSIGQTQIGLVSFKDNNAFSFEFRNKAGNNFYNGKRESITKYEIGNWYDILMTFDGSSKKQEVYINGKQEHHLTLSLTGDFEFNDGTGFIGAQSWTNASGYNLTNFMNGKIKNVRVYNEKLSLTEINDFFNLSSPNLIQGDVSFATSIYPLQSNANDSNNYFNGIEHGNISYVSNGNGGNCADLNGTDEYIYLLPLKKINLSNDYSFSCWVNADTTHTGCIFNGRTWDVNLGRTFCGLVYFDSSGYIKSYLRNSDMTYSQASTSSSTYSTGTWYHIVFTWDGSAKQQKLYINNAIDSNHTKTGTGTFSFPDGKGMIGALGYRETTEQESWYLNGKISKFKIYNSVLNTTEINALYSEGY